MTTPQFDIDFFFTLPTVPPEQAIKDNKQSVLYLLRREIQDCFIGTVIDEAQVTSQLYEKRRRLFATTVMIFAGIDLLGKFVAGTNCKGKANGDVTSRFTGFAKDFMGLSADQASAVYKFRNAMLHSFGLFDDREQKTLSFQALPEKIKIGVISQTSDGWLLHLPDLFDAFVQGVEKYRYKLDSDSALKQNFGQAFPFYGWLFAPQNEVIAVDNPMDMVTVVQAHGGDAT